MAPPQPLSADLLADLPEPSPEALVQARARACACAGHSQAQAARAAGIAHAVNWSQYERGIYRIDAARWALYLLATGQHPGARLAAPRHRGKAALTGAPATVEKS